jgi:hypothetical protein
MHGTAGHVLMAACSVIHSCRRRSVFTLIELLVVIAMISY